VSIEVTLVSQSLTSATIRFAVRDTGVGIAQDNLVHIFEDFTQAESSTNRRYGGTGLGLSISRRLVALMGGELRVESLLGAGSTFHFELVLPLASTSARIGSTDSLSAAANPDSDTPLAATIAKTTAISSEAGARQITNSPPPFPIMRPASQNARLAGMRILVAEDNQLNQFIAKELLVDEGAIVEIATDGYDAVEAVRNAKPPFDAVLMDIQMPGLDGYEATRAIRETLGLRDLPIIAMTASAMAADQEACLAAGMNDHIGKPIPVDYLISILARLGEARVPA
jgi:CheY-like chemotaxis protein